MSPQQPSGPPEQPPRPMTGQAWRRVVASAASLDERRGLPGLRSSAVQEPARERTQSWLAAVGADRRRSFADLLIARGWTQEAQQVARGQVPDSLREVEVRDEASLPRWALTLREALVDLGDPPYPLEGLPPTIAALWPWTQVGVRRLDAALPADCLDAAARWDLLCQLGRRLVQVASQVFDQELHAQRAAAALTGSIDPGPAELGCDGAAWSERLTRYPVLGRLLAVTVDHWADATSALIRHLVEDAPAVEAELGLRLMPVRRAQADAGDQHDGGRSVLILEGPDGKVVYKPKPLEIAVGWQRLAALLELPRRAVAVRPGRDGDPRDGRTWESFVAHHACADSAGVRRFYHRLGGTLRLLQLLAARDFWLDNLVAHGDEPHFIDLEMALQPEQFAGGDELLAVERELVAAVERTVVPTGVVAYRSPIAEGLEAVDLGALSPQRPLASPYRLKLLEGARLGIEAEQTASGHVSWEKAGFVPTVAGEPAQPSEFLADVVEGYRALHRRLLDRRAEVASCLAELAGNELRIIVRDTWTYQRLMQESVQTRLLTGGVARDLYFERLLRGARSRSGWDAAELAIAEAEVEQLRGLDVPIFRMLADGRALVSSGGPVASERYARSPLATARQRLAGLDSFDLEHHVAVLRSCFGTGSHPLVPPAAWRRREGATGVAADASHPLELACQIADEVLAWAHRGAGGALAWFGLVDQPQVQVKVLEVLRPTAGGSAGWARLFAYLARHTGEARFRRAARGALASAEQSARLAFERWPETVLVPGSTSLGAVFGIGAQLLTLHEVGALLDEPELCRLADRYADALPPFEGMVDGCSSPWTRSAAGGVVGLLWVLAAIGHARAPELARALVARPEMASVEALEAADPAGQGVGLNVPFASLPDTAGALARALSLCPTPSLVAAGEELARRLPAANRCGAHLTREAAPEPHCLELASANSTALLDALELSLARASRAGVAPEAARGVLGELTARRLRYGSWFPDRHGADRHDLSAIDGLGAVAWSALRLATAAPSPRLPGDVGSPALATPRAASLESVS